MQTTVNLPDSLYEKSEVLAARQGSTVEEFIVEAVAKQVQGSPFPNPAVSYGSGQVNYPSFHRRGLERSTCLVSISMIYLPDVNVWIALAAEKHILHGAAMHCFSNLQDRRLVFCRLTQMGFLRLLSNPHVMQEELMTPGGAWQAYRLLRSDQRIGYLPEPDHLGETWDGFTQGRSKSSNLWTDAYLCAFAQAAGLTLVTFDAKIPAREGLSCLLLTKNI